MAHKINLVGPRAKALARLRAWSDRYAVIQTKASNAYMNFRRAVTDVAATK